MTFKLIPLKTALFVSMMSSALILSGCLGERAHHRSFADYPGFKEYYGQRCLAGEDDPPVTPGDQKLLEQYRPRLILSPGGRYPIDFYKDYLPYTVLRRYSDKEIEAEAVTPELLKAVQADPRYYLDFQFDRFQKAGRDWRYREGAESDGSLESESSVYGRVYRERVDFQPSTRNGPSRNLIFLKYNIVFAISGLAKKLPMGYETFLRLAGLDLEDWHALDNFVAIHMVLDDQEQPVAVILAQHNHHRTYLLGKDLPLPSDGRQSFDIALRSNEVYPASSNSKPVEHRVIRWSMYLRYLLSGEDPPFARGTDMTYGLGSGGKEISYNLIFLSPCDPFYTTKILLGEPRPFWGRYIGRDGPPGSDYYAVPALLPMGNLLKFSYLHDGDPEDIRLVEEAIDLKKKTIDIEKIISYGGMRLSLDWSLTSR